MSSESFVPVVGMDVAADADSVFFVGTDVANELIVGVNREPFGFLGIEPVVSLSFGEGGIVVESVPGPFVVTNAEDERDFFSFEGFDFHGGSQAGYFATNNLFVFMYPVTNKLFSWTTMAFTADEFGRLVSLT